MPNLPLAACLPLSLVDWPGRLCAVIFTQGCNLRCGFCHNAHLIPKIPCGQGNPVDWALARNKLLKHQRLVNSIVVSGGEPTMHQELETALALLRRDGFQLKLDTNGSNPKMLIRLLNLGLIDFVALDAKGLPGSKLDAVVQAKGYSDRWLKSLKILCSWPGEWELRTTIHQELFSEELCAMNQLLPAQIPWYWQACRPVGQEKGNLDGLWAQNTSALLGRVIGLRGWEGKTGGF